MPSYVISEYASGRVVFALENGTESELYQLRNYVQEYKKISRVENQFIVHHPDGSDTDTAGHPVPPDAAALLFQMKVKHIPNEVILSMDIPENTPGARLGINQIKAYASKLNIVEQRLLTYERIVPKIELTGAGADAAQRAYDLEKLNYKNELKKQDRRKAIRIFLLGLVTIIGAIAAIILTITVPVFSWFIVSVGIVGIAVLPIGLVTLFKGSVDWMFLPEHNEMLQKYNDHFGPQSSQAVCLIEPTLKTVDTKPDAVVDKDKVIILPDQSKLLLEKTPEATQAQERAS